MIAAGQSADVDIQDVAYGGKAVARLDGGAVCFIPGALPGERVRIEVVRAHRNFFEGRLVRVLASAPARVEPACPLARPGACSGCCYQHASYETEVRLKDDQFRALLARNAGCDPSLCLPPVAAPAALAYRNKVVLHAQRDGAATRLGYYMDDNTTVVDVPACPLAMPALNGLLADLRAKPGFLPALRDGMPLTLRCTERDGALWWRGRASDQDTWLVEASRIGPIATPRNSFYQMNPAVGDLLLDRIGAILAETAPRMVIDLYCGVGVFALAAAATVPAVIGVDIDGPAIQAAAYNARQHGRTNLRWVAGAADKGLPKLGTELAAPGTTLIADPPRTGLGRELVRQLARHAPGRIIYVSCAADTLTRDVAWLKEAGYTVERARLFDMFPRTAHFESVTELKRAG
jgi:23S rRNA (uracil1939-C5)-methyltransferase